MSDRPESPERDAAEGGDASDAAGPEEDGTERDRPDDSEHLDDIEDGAGCAEIWERLSERREAAREEAAREEAAREERSG
jgi:hypothetical protein